jgi:hypothetical protein
LVIFVTDKPTDLHRATPEQWEHVQICAGMKQEIPWATADCILELRARIEALEVMQHAHADVSRLSDAEREQVTQELAKPAAWRPLDIETTYGTEAATFTARQILRAPIVVEGTFEHGGETYRFKAKPEREGAMTELRAASAEVRPTVKDSLTDGGGLVERVARSIERTVDFNPDSYAPEARAAIREVAAWLREGGDYSANAWADMLEREVFRG